MTNACCRTHLAFGWMPDISTEFHACRQVLLLYLVDRITSSHSTSLCCCCCLFSWFFDTKHHCFDFHVYPFLSQKLLCVVHLILLFLHIKLLSVKITSRQNRREVFCGRGESAVRIWCSHVWDKWVRRSIKKKTQLRLERGQCEG